MNEYKSYKLYNLETPKNILYLNFNSKLKLVETGLGFTINVFFIISYSENICRGYAIFQMYQHEGSK